MVPILRSAGRAENFFFGLTAEEVDALKARGYNPELLPYQCSTGRSNDLIASGHFSQGTPTYLLLDSLLHQDQYMLFADYQSVECQDRASQAYQDRKLDADVDSECGADG